MYDRYHNNTGVAELQGATWALTCDASGGQGQAERDVVFVVTHLSQEFEFQLTQDLPDTKNIYYCIVLTGFSISDASLLINAVSLNSIPVKLVFTLLSVAVIMFM